MAVTSSVHKILVLCPKSTINSTWKREFDERQENCIRRVPVFVFSE